MDVHFDKLSSKAYLQKHSVAQLYALRCSVTKRVVVVANTHLYYKGGAKNVQSAQLVRQIDDFVASLKESLNVRPAVVVCGDFNATPKSEVFKTMTATLSSAVPIATVDDAPQLAPLSAATPNDDEQKVTGFALSGVFPLRCTNLLHWWYQEPKRVFPAGAATSLTTNPKVLDYVFHSKELVVLGYLGLPMEAVFTPNKQEPSDHIPLVVRLALA